MNSRPRDGFARYYAEKIWEMIPAIYRHEDGLGRDAGVLRAFVNVLAEEAAVLRRSHDRLWDDQYIDLCDEWAVPYIGDLVGARLVSALNPRGRRVDVAKTIYYRRRKGTPRVLEELIGDIAGWEGKVVESFQRMARTRHGLDPKPGPLAGRFSSTLPGGWADLRNAYAAKRAGSPFDEFFHTADVRQHRGGRGRYAIPKVACHLYRIQVFRVEGVDPHVFGNTGGSTFDPSGRDIPLFGPRARSSDAYEWDAWRSAREWEVPGPMRCRILGHEEFEITEEGIARLCEAGMAEEHASEFRMLAGERIRSERDMNAALASFTSIPAGMYRLVRTHTMIEDCGKHALIPNAVNVDVPSRTLEQDAIAAAGLEFWSTIATEKDLAIDPALGRFLFASGGPGGDGVTVSYHYGFSGEIGAGTYDRRHVEELTPDSAGRGGGIIDATGILVEAADVAVGTVFRLADSRTYRIGESVAGIRRLTMQAANRQRPYVILSHTWQLETAADPATHEDAVLTLDGIWFGGSDIVLRGDYECVTIRHVTLDPGGKNATGDAIPRVGLIIEGFVEKLTIESSIVGSVSTGASGSVGGVIIRDTILDSGGKGSLSLAIESGTVHMERVTVFGGMRAHRLWASEVLATGNVDVSDTQSGCFRFSAAAAGSTLPRPFESFEIPHTGCRHYFTSVRFGDPGYAQLSQVAPVEITEGAENGSEMGAFSGLMNPIKARSLDAKVCEYAPFGIIPLYIPET